MKKETFVTKEQLDEIIKTYPTPFHIYDEKGIRENAKALKEAFPDLTDDVTLSSVLRYPDVLKQEDSQSLDEEMTKALDIALNMALDKLNETSGKLGADKSKLLRAYVNSGGVVAVVDSDVLSQIRQIHTDISRIGSLLKWTAGSLADICENPFIAQNDIATVRALIEQTKKLENDLKISRSTLVTVTEKLNKAARRVNNGDI